MKYDDASWHYGGEFPAELSVEAGSTHIGMFVAWALLAGLGGALHVVEFPEDLQRLRERSVTPGQFVREACDEKLTDEDLNDVGNAFAAAYFAPDEGQYLADYELVLGGPFPTLYHVPDTWEGFDALRPVLDRRFDEWRREQPET